MKVKVECYSGYRGEETPRKLWMGSKSVYVKEILKRWATPDYRYFRIKSDDENIYTIRYDEISCEWEQTS